MQFWNQPDSKAYFQFAKSLTAHHSKSFFAAASVLPKDRRWATYAVYAFCRHADNLVDIPRHRTNAELLHEVDTFRNELARAYRTGESEHPILKPFIIAAYEYGIPEHFAQDLLRGVEMDLEIKRYDTFEDLYVFCYRVAGVVGLMMTHVFGYRSEEAFSYAEKMGIAMQLTNILRDVQEDKNMGRIYIPRAEMEKFGVQEHDIFTEQFTENVFALMKSETDRAKKYYTDAQPGISLLPPHSQFAVASASRIYGGILNNIVHRNYNPFLGRVVVPQRRKIAILLQEIIRSKRKQFSFSIFG